MKKTSVILILGLALAAVDAPANDSFSSQCPDLASCIKAVSKLTGDSYTYEGDLKARMATSDNAELNSQNADLLFSHMLDLNGLTRVPLGQARSYTIMRQRDAKDTLLPKATATVKFEPVLPNTWDWYDLSYELAHPEVMTEITRLVRNFMPPNTRVIGSEVTGKIMVTGPVPVLRRVYGIIKDMDRQLTPAQKKQIEARKEEKKSSSGAAKSPEPVRE